jgi:hypothetical protein
MSTYVAEREDLEAGPAAVTSSTARSKAASFACDGFV